MALEEVIAENTAALKILISVLQSGAAVSGTANDKPTTGGKSTTKDKKDEKPATDTKPSTDTKTTSAGLDWDKDVQPKLLELNRSTAAGQGREAIVALLAQFLPETAAADRKVPLLKALGKNAEILKAVTDKLAPAAAAEDDLGI